MQTDIIINVKYVVDKEGKTHQSTTKTIKNIQLMGNRIVTSTKKFIGHRKVMETVTNRYRQFRGEILSIMFFGYALQQTFGGLMQSSMDMMGVFDILNTFLGVVFLPVAEFFLNLVMALWDIWDKLPQPIKDFVIVLVPLLAVLGTIIAAFGVLSMGLAGIGAFFGISAAAVLPFIAIIIAVIAIAALLYTAWKNNLWGFRDVTEQVFSWIWNKIQFVMNSVKFLITSALDFLKAIWEGRWTDAYNIVVNVFNKIFKFLSTLPSYFYNLGVTILTKFIDGIKSLSSSVATAFWNILPKWLQNAISGIGTFAKSVVNLFGGMFSGFTPMQHGGIVTSPTPALIGERGPEAVIPLDRIGSIGGINITINTSNLGGNTDQIAREIAEKFAFELSRVRY